MRRDRLKGAGRGAAAVHFQSLVEANVDMVHQVRVRPGGWMVEYVSPSTTEILGWSCEEALRLKPHEFFAEWSLPIAVADLERVLRGGPARFATLQVHHKNGSLVWVEFRVRLLKQGKDDATVVITGRDVTEFKKLEAELADMVLVDALTGIGNRRAFDAAIQREWTTTLSSGRPLSLVMVDIDHFKRVNDTCGHQIGDACLRAIAEAMRRLLQATDAVVTRYGGEELAVLLPNMPLEQAMVTAEELRLAVARLPLPAFETCGALTVSCGVSAAPSPPVDCAEMPADLVVTADLALYEAKRLGRNRVIAHQEADQARAGSGSGLGTRSRSQP